MKDILSILQEVENQVGDFYIQIYNKISDEYPALALLFKDLADEEREHAKKIEMMRQNKQDTSGFMDEKDDAIHIVEKVLAKIKNHRTAFQENPERFSPGELLELAIDMETEMEMRHYSFYTEVKNENLKKLFNHLVVSDQGHKEILDNNRRKLK